MVVRITEKIEAGKRNGSTHGWTGVVLNRVIRLTVTFEQSPEEVRRAMPVVQHQQGGRGA